MLFQITGCGFSVIFINADSAPCELAVLCNHKMQLQANRMFRQLGGDLSGVICTLTVLAQTPNPEKETSFIPSSW